MKNFIAASLIAADFWSLSKEFKKLDNTQVKWVHYDIMDGHFVPNISVGSCELSSLIKKTNIEIDIHFMVTNPDIIVPNFIKMFKNRKLKNITVHAETCRDIKKLSKITRKSNIKFGLAISPESSIKRIIKNIEYIDLALIMTVKPGFAGQDIITKCINKVKRLSKFFKENNIDLPIQGDGGIKLKNISLLSDAGANIFVSGTGIFKTNNYKVTVDNMMKIINK